MNRTTILKDIQSRDPDGGTRQPTDADYKAHKAWAIDTYGAEMWCAYFMENWDTQTPVWA